MVEQDNMPKQVHNIVPILTCRNLSETIAFYMDKLGFELGFEWFDEEFDGPTTYAILHHNTHCIHFVQAEMNEDIQLARLYIFCSGLELYFDAFKAQNVKTVEDWKNFPIDETEFTVIDPDGHRLTFGKEGE